MSLLEPVGDARLEAMAQESRRLTRLHFGRTIRLFAPIYLSNECINNCKYCGFSRDNPIIRTTLTVDEVVQEARYLHGLGLRSILLESCPAFEALVDLSDGPQLRLMASLGGAWSVADAGPRRAAALTRGAARGKIEALVRSTTSSTRPDASVVAAEDRAVKLLARRISENSAEIEAITAEISALLEGDDTYRCLLTVPGIGPKTASELAISIDIEDFPSHDRLASYCGLAPRNRQSGTSISSVTASRQGNKRLKNLLIFSCNCLTRTEGRWGDYYTRCRERGMSHGKALKALARKRLKVIYAVMRDRVPYAA